MPDRSLFADSPESVGVDPERLEALFARVAKEVEEGLLPSAQVAVARNGRLAGMRTFGAATDDTLYVVFSATKAITSAAGWLLIQEGKPHGGCLMRVSKDVKSFSPCAML